MKTSIHPQYHSDTKVKCACGNTWITGSTLPEIQVEICSNCHPFYTGKEKVLDTRGRIDRFKKRITKQEESTAQKLIKKTRVAKNKKTH